MGCNCQNADCLPDTTTEPTPPHVCKCGDIQLKDGRFENATVVVEAGCIRSIERGLPQLYTPNVCCAGAGSSSGGGGAIGQQGPQGEPGENATISIGVVNTVAPGTQASVENVGTATNAILNFNIPAGMPGASGETSNGITSDKGGLQIQNGSIIGLPASWPPVMYMITDSKTTGVELTVTDPDPNTGLVTIAIDLSKYEERVKEDYEYQLNEAKTSLQEQLTAQNTAIAALQTAVDALQKSMGNKQ
ncbi:MAG: hypothetical protein NC080_07390 [Paraprevotella sp.]|nr:hypothetical protein [Paraprevotella sp.]